MRRRCVAFLVIIILLTVSTAAYGFIWPIGNSYTPHHSLVNLDPLLGIILLTIGNISRWYIYGPCSIRVYGVGT